jgi:hypothetical protein
LRVSKKSGNFLARRVTINFSRTLLHTDESIYGLWTENSSEAYISPFAAVYSAAANVLAEE